MTDTRMDNSSIGNTNDIPEIIYRSEKDFYKGLKGELRYKAEGLFKKAKEKGISIEEINIEKTGSSIEKFPGIGDVELPSYIVKVKGRDISTGQVITDGKLIDYRNRFLKYMIDCIEDKNLLKDERGRIVKDAGGRIRYRDKMDFTLSDSEKFEIGKSLVDDKEFGLEKTITGACDRVIRKLMGENDWLYPEEAKMLDEEFNKVQQKIAQQEAVRAATATGQRKATERQLNYLKARLKNLGIDPDNSVNMDIVLELMGFAGRNITELSTTDVSRIIDNINANAENLKDAVSKVTRDENTARPQINTPENWPLKQ